MVFFMEVFDRWNKEKQQLHKQGQSPYFSVGDIWWSQLGQNIVSESMGKGDDFLRPVLILQKFYGRSALVLPLTKQNKQGNYYFRFQNKHGGFHTAMLPQVRYIDGNRLKRKLSAISKSDLFKIQQMFFQLVQMKNYPPGVQGGSPEERNQLS